MGRSAFEKQSVRETILLRNEQLGQVHLQQQDGGDQRETELTQAEERRVQTVIEHALEQSTRWACVQETKKTGRCCHDGREEDMCRSSQRCNA